MDHSSYPKTETEQGHDAEKLAGDAGEAAVKAVGVSAAPLLRPGTVRRRRRLSQVGVAALERSALGAELAQSGKVSQEQTPGTAPVLLVSGRRKSATDLEQLISHCGHPVTRVRSLGKMIQKGLGFRLKRMVVDLDSCSSLVQTVDDLVRLREDCPNLTVVVVSKQVKRDDFSLERLAMCDVTLRLPAGAEDLEFALEEARINNRVWVMRCRQTKLESTAIATDMKPLCYRP